MGDVTEEVVDDFFKYLTYTCLWFFNVLQV